MPRERDKLICVLRAFAQAVAKQGWQSSVLWKHEVCTHSLQLLALGKYELLQITQTGRGRLTDR